MLGAALVGRRFHFSRRSPGHGWNGRIAMLLRYRFAAGLLFVLATQAFADTPISIQYTLVPLGGNVYQYVYSIRNNGTLPGGSAVKLFDIFFDSSLYQKSSLQIVTPSSLQSQWSEVLLAVIPPVIPAEYDVLSLQGGIPVGGAVTGFSVKFTWLGSGVPGAQVFQISDPSTFQVLQTGQTVLDPTSVPAASTLSLILIGLGLALLAAYQIRFKNPQPARTSIGAE
jgi:hypothetical protein